MSEATNPTVLVVEDEALLLYSIADDLRNEGFEVLEALNADEALSILSTNPNISLLFTDIDMPGSMDGIKLAAAVRDRWPPVRIIVTSGKGSPDPSVLPDRVFLPKPYSPKAVSDALRRLQPRPLT